MKKIIPSFMLMMLLLMLGGLQAEASQGSTDASFSGYYLENGTYQKQSIVTSYTSVDQIQDLPSFVAFIVNNQSVEYPIASWDTTNLTDSYGAHEIYPIFDDSITIPGEVEPYIVFQSPLNTELTNHSFEILPKALILSGKWRMYYLDNPNYLIESTGLEPTQDPSFGWQSTEYSNFRESEAGQPYYRQMEINQVSCYASSSTGLVTGQIQGTDETIPGFSSTETRVAEINAREISSIYQDLNTVTGGEAQYSFYHGGREVSGNPTQYMAVIIGPSHFSENVDPTQYGASTAYTTGENGNNSKDLFHHVYFQGLKDEQFSDWLITNATDENHYADIQSLMAKISFYNYDVPYFANDASWQAAVSNGLLSSYQREKINQAFVDFCATLDNGTLTISYQQNGWEEAEEWTIKPSSVEANRWTEVSGSYTIPEDQDATVFSLISIPSSGLDSYEGNLVTDLYFGLTKSVTFCPNAANVSLSDGTSFPVDGFTGEALGGKSTPVSDLLSRDGLSYSAADIPIRKYYEFDGWSTNRFAQPGSSSVLSVEEISQLPLNQNTYYYAIWKAADDYALINIRKQVYGLSETVKADLSYNFELTLTNPDGTAYDGNVILSYSDGTIEEVKDNPDLMNNGVISLTLNNRETVQVLAEEGTKYQLREILPEDEAQYYDAIYNDLTVPFIRGGDSGSFTKSKNPYIICNNLVKQYVAVTLLNSNGEALEGNHFHIYDNYDPSTETLSDYIGSVTTNSDKENPQRVIADSGEDVLFDPAQVYYLQEDDNITGEAIDPTVYMLYFDMVWPEGMYIPVLKVYSSSVWSTVTSSFPNVRLNGDEGLTTVTFQESAKTILPNTGTGLNLLWTGFFCLTVGAVLLFRKGKCR